MLQPHFKGGEAEAAGGSVLLKVSTDLEMSVGYGEAALVSSFCPSLPGAPECGLSSVSTTLSGTVTASPPTPQIRSVIRRSRETGHAHPMSREPSPRRRLDPATLSRTPSQERLIAELQGRLGIQPEAEEAAGLAGAPAEDWMTEGVIITVQPRGRRAGGQLVEKVAGRCAGLGQGQGIPLLTQRWPEGGLGVCAGVLHPVALGGRPQSWYQSGKAQRSLGVPPVCALLAELLLPLPSSSSLSFLPSPQVVFPPDSPIPLRRTFSVLPSPPPVPLLQHHRDASASSSSPPPSLPTPSTLGPSVISRGSPGVQSSGAGPREEDAQGPTSPSTAPYTSRSVGCQTEEDPLFPPMQAGPGPQRES
ncbi:uncharacterized protein LOC111736985 [Pteropus vampyrus]|uniref:Uncharacterized protein LOC111736985 n=1 Tax=Pteropus vampyrus TaxID=132908 RepID=A0A6P6C9L6_PTEVA|nr:uncharacterized protein LOC111736985 [Pteropus vampyrus]